MSTVSVIIPTFNRAHTLGRALTSVFGQTRQPDEVIVVDDASTDSTAAVMRQFPRARHVQLTSNRGAAHARNHGVKMATGDYVAFLDSDDVWLANKLEAQLGRMEAGSGISLICTGVTVLESPGVVKYHGFNSSKPANGWSFLEFQTCPFSPTTWLMRRSVFLDEGLFDESLPNGEDLDFLARINSNQSIEFLSEPLSVKYNLSDSLDGNLSKTVASFSILLSRHRDLWNKTPAAVAIRFHWIANMYAWQNSMPDVRAHLRQAVRYQPWNIKYVMLFWASVLGKAVYFKVSRLPLISRKQW